MPDWTRITATAEHALTLDDDARQAFLDEVSSPDQRDAIGRLVKRAAPRSDFLATSMPGAQESRDILPSGVIVGAWRIDEHVGRGGMGDVYKASRADGLYDQTVALKLIQGMSPARAALFEAERRRLALMDHPGIARIIDGGASDDGRPYMAMDFVDGMPITEHADRASLSRQARLALFRSVCVGVGHAHGKLVLHRDIKAENVLVDRDGHPRLIDFGIASHFEEETGAGGPLTLATAAPEQLKGEAVSVQTDIFGLGVLLHELLTGKRPTRTGSGGMEADTGAIGDPDIAAILAMTLATDPGDRYSSVSALGDDIAAVLARRPVSARRGGWRDSATKFMQRYPLASALGACAILALAGGMAVSLKFAGDASAEAERAKTALAEAEENLERSKYYLDRSNLFFSTQSAYADTLQSMFGGEADVERQTEILKQRWRQAYELREEDPDNAAYLGYAIGRHFVFRNDYLTAIDILEPWIEEAYGPSDLVGYARQLLAVAYMSIGRNEEALPILRETEAWFASGFDAASPDHIAAATQIALITESDEDIVLAERLLQIGLGRDDGDSINMYFLNQLSRMRQMRGDFAGAYEAMLDVVAIIDGKPLMDVSGTDTGRLNLADFELWHTGDLDRAEALALAVLDTARETKGESRELGLAHGILAWVNAGRGDFSAARDEIDTAIAITARYSGEDASSVVALRLHRAEILADLSDDEARQAIDEIRAEIEGTDRYDQHRDRLNLADLYVMSRLDGVDAARNRSRTLDLDRRKISRNLQLRYLSRRLSEFGAIDPA